MILLLNTDVNEYEYWNNPNSASLRDVINAPPSVSMVRQNLLLPPHGVANEIAASYPDYVYVNNVCLLRCRNFYGIDKKIIFKDNGINQNVMKSLLPEISFSAWYVLILMYFKICSLYKIIKQNVSQGS